MVGIPYWERRYARARHDYRNGNTGFRIRMLAQYIIFAILFLIIPFMGIIVVIRALVIFAFGMYTKPGNNKIYNKLNKLIDDDKRDTIEYYKLSDKYYGFTPPASYKIKVTIQKKKSKKKTKKILKKIPKTKKKKDV